MILSYVQIGGVVRDIDADTLRWICDKLDSIEGEYKEICATFLKGFLGAQPFGRGWAT